MYDVYKYNLMNTVSLYCTNCKKCIVKFCENINLLFQLILLTSFKINLMQDAFLNFYKT